MASGYEYDKLPTSCDRFFLSKKKKANIRQHRIREMILSEVMGLKDPSFDFTKMDSMSFPDAFSRFSVISRGNLLKTSLMHYSVFRLDVH